MCQPDLRSAAFLKTDLAGTKRFKETLHVTDHTNWPDEKLAKMKPSRSTRPHPARTQLGLGRVRTTCANTKPHSGRYYRGVWQCSSDLCPIRES
jgi:hypothetical protein